MNVEELKAMQFRYKETNLDNKVANFSKDFGDLKGKSLEEIQAFNNSIYSVIQAGVEDLSYSTAANLFRQCVGGVLYIGNLFSEKARIEEKKLMENSAKLARQASRVAVNSSDKECWEQESENIFKETLNLYEKNILYERIKIKSEGNNYRAIRRSYYFNLFSSSIAYECGKEVKLANDLSFAGKYASMLVEYELYKEKILFWAKRWFSHKKDSSELFFNFSQDESIIDSSKRYYLMNACYDYLSTGNASIKVNEIEPNPYFVREGLKAFEKLLEINNYKEKPVLKAEIIEDVGFKIKTLEALL